MTKEGSTKNVNFTTSGAGFFARAWPYKSYNEIALFLLKSSILWGKIQTNKGMVIMTEEGSTNIDKFHEPLCRGSCA